MSSTFQQDDRKFLQSRVRLKVVLRDIFGVMLEVILGLYRCYRRVI